MSYRQRKRRKRVAITGKFILDFGCHRGKRLDQVPLDYVRWLAADCHDETAKWIAKQFLSSRKLS